MEYTPKLTDMDVLEQARDVLTEHLPLEADGYVCTGADLWQILLGASAKQGTIHSMCQSMEDAPSDATVRGYLNEQLTDEKMHEIEKQMNAALASQIPKPVFKRARDTGMCQGVCNNLGQEFRLEMGLGITSSRWADGGLGQLIPTALGG